MQTRHSYALRFGLIVIDLLLINFIFFATLYLTNQLNDVWFDGLYRQYIFRFNLIWLFSANFFGLYKLNTIQSMESVYRSTWRSFVAHSILFVFNLTFAQDTHISRLFLVFFYVNLAVGLIISRFIITLLQVNVKKRFSSVKPVAVLGMNRTGTRLAHYFDRNKNEFSFEGFLKEEDSLYVDSNGRLLPNTYESIQVAAQRGIKEVYVTLTPDKVNQVGELLTEAEKQCVRVKFVPAMEKTITSFNVNYMGGFPVISLRKEPLEDVDNSYKKRFFDIAFSSLVIIFILSWLYPIIALIIKLQNSGPVLFKQERSGRDNKTFTCYKFRSMRVNDKCDSQQATKNDNRITPVGKFLRKTNLDELPQFFNVLMGDMSVVGPRPHMLKHTEQYRAIINQYMVRHFLKPGITGWAQVNGFRGETKNPRQMKKRVEYDIWYLENWSAMLDVRIVFLTIINMFKGEKNAY